MEKNIETFIGCDCEYDEAKIVLFGAPYDSTTSFRPGARFGCKAIRSESFGLETYSPYQDDELTEKKVFDSGDLELVFGNAQTALGQIEERARTILNDGKLPFMVGGEHLVTLGAFRAVYEKYPEVSIIHFDAHADLRADYLGEKMSHASVLRRCHELVGDGRIYQFGIRSGDRQEFLWGREHVCTRMFDFEGVDQVVEQLKGRPVYFTLDLDVLDPSVFPGTGTPEAGGVSFMQLLNACLKLRGLNIVGLDVNELAPAYDISGVSTAVAGKIIRELLIMLG
ncbi:MAG TPA: agmatinase [Candidatus Onthovicinus excrementipullorum]|nr:agmatinase [Candidatus Onthovicinus excrementipullorum]